jgi:hypothetical protein
MVLTKIAMPLPPIRMPVRSITLRKQRGFTHTTRDIVVPTPQGQLCAREEPCNSLRYASLPFDVHATLYQVRLGWTRSLTEVRTAGIALERANILLRSAGTVSMGSHCRSSLLPVAGPHRLPTSARFPIVPLVESRACISPYIHEPAITASEGLLET